MQEPSSRILQIIPAEGWKAHYKNEDEAADFIEPIVCFALVEETDTNGKKKQTVLPMSWSDYEVDFCENTGNFSKISYQQ
jgi:hypothetical protein